MPPSPVQSVWITVSVVSGLQNNTCLQPWDLSSSSSSSPLLPRCSLSSLASSPSSSSSPSPPLTAVHVHLAHDTGDSQDIPPLSTKGVLQPSVYSRIHWAGFQSLTDPFLCVLLQIFTLPTALTSFHKASLFTWVPSFSWRGGGTSFPLFYLDILGLKIINLSAVFSLSLLFFFFPVTLPLLLPLWQNTTALISWVSKCCSHPLLLWTPLQPFPSTSD